MKEAVRKFKETVEMKSSAFNRIKEHRYFSLGVLFAVVLFAASFHVWQRVRVMTLAKEVGHLRVENGSLLDDKKKLYSDIASLTTSSRIETYARDTLGLKSAQADRLYTLIKKDAVRESKDEFDVMLAAFKRVTDYIPVVEQTRAEAKSGEKIHIDSILTVLGGE